MIRRARWLLLAVIALISGFVYFTFVSQRALLRSSAPKRSEPLPPNTASSRENWTWRQFNENGGIKVELSARTMQQIKEPATVLLEDVEMKIYDKKGKAFHRVKCKSATFEAESQTMYSEGDVEITLSEPAAGTVKGRILSIRSSGVSVDNKSSRIWTDRAAEFQFDSSAGSSSGAEYDPGTRELRMKNDVKLDWQGRGPKSQPMHIEASQLSYRESDAQVFLVSPVRLNRATLTLASGDAVVYLKEGAIERVETVSAKGADDVPKRRIDFEAKTLRLFFTPKGEMTRAETAEGARIVSTAPSARTTISGERIDLDFDTAERESMLKKAMAYGAVRVESNPLGAPPAKLPPNRILSSETVELLMRPGGRDVDRIVTHSPGQVDFLPNRPGERKRHMDATRLSLVYAPNNQLQSFRAVEVKTRTETPAARNVPARAMTTSSQDLEAEFDPVSGDMKRLEQWQNFQYEEGARAARAERALLDSARDTITLRTGARMADETGSTSADEIVVNQKTDDFTATGNVTSARLPDKKQSSAGMLDGGEPIQARAQRMQVTEKNQKIRYEGNAALWQGASRLTADSIFIDRANGRLEASGQVVSTFPDRKAATKTPKTPAFSVVRAPEMTYSDKDKLAHYRNGVQMDRPNVVIKSRELKAVFREEKAGQIKETKLDHLLADGAVHIDERSQGRTRNGAAEHGEYHIDEERMQLSGGNPVLIDSKSGQTRGAVITWWARDDRLLVDNTGSGPAVSRINKKK